MAKDKCRICLEHRKNMFSLYDLNGEISYLDMVAFLAAKKIVLNYEFPKKICHLCGRKLKQAYDFKVLIQRSDMELHGNQRLKIINFSNLSDIKIKIEITETDNDYSDPIHYTKKIMKGEECITYNDVEIKKVCNDAEKTHEPLPVLDFLKSIKNEYDNVYASEVDIEDYSMDNDAETTLPWQPIKAKKRKKKHTKDAKGTEVKNICIKPVYLKDVRVMYYDDKSNIKKKYKYPAAKMRKDICPFCGKVTMSLKTHILVHTGERNFKCEICSKGFFNKHTLNNHKQKHDGVRGYKCDHCVAAFTDKSSLKSHMTSHSDQRNCICDVCNKGFKRKGALKRHIKIHNFVNKIFKCDLCSMSFYNNVSLKHHIRVHTGERPYRCEICSQPYSYKHDFNRHCFKKHGVFLKRRSVYVMNKEVLMQERELMRDLLLRTQGVMNDNKPLNPFVGPQASLAFEQAVKALKTQQIPLDL